MRKRKASHRSVHAAFVNTKWYEAWLERSLLLDPIIFDMWSPGVLSWAPGQHCNSHHATLVKTHLLFRVFVVVLSSITSRSVAASAASSLMRFSPCPICCGESLVGVLVHQSCWLCLTPSLCVFSESIVIACVFPQSIIIALYFCVFSLASGAARARSFCTHQRSRITESTVFKDIHHKDRRQQQLFQRLALHDCTASYVRSRSRHIFWASLGTPRADGARQGRRAHEADPVS